MESQEKKELVDLSKKFGTEVLSKYIKAADPNEMGRRNLLEIIILKLHDAYDIDDIAELNSSLQLMIERGLDTSRKVFTLAFPSSEYSSPSLIQIASNLENISSDTFKAILAKEKRNLSNQPNSGLNILIGRIKNKDAEGFKALLDENLRLTPDLAEEGLKTLTAVSNESDTKSQIQDTLYIGKELIKMRPNLFNIKLFNNTIAFEDVLSEKGQEELSSLVKALKIDTTIEQQDVIEVENAETIFDNTFARGL